MTTTKSPGRMSEAQRAQVIGLRRSNAARAHIPKPLKGTRTARKAAAIREQRP